MRGAHPNQLRCEARHRLPGMRITRKAITSLSSSVAFWLGARTILDTFALGP
jgi:hypothetical protein